MESRDFYYQKWIENMWKISNQITGQIWVFKVDMCPNSTFNLPYISTKFHISKCPQKWIYNCLVPIVSKISTRSSHCCSMKTYQQKMSYEISQWWYHEINYFPATCSIRDQCKKTLRFHQIRNKVCWKKQFFPTLLSKTIT